MPGTEQLKAIVVEQLKTLIPAGKLCCALCHRPLGGRDVVFINVDERKVEYKCPKADCENHDKTGYRTFRGLKIVLPARDIPAEISTLDAPTPPSPESVEVEDTDEGVESNDP